MADKKEEIMQSAIHLFSKKGYFSTTIQDIANDCRISKGSLYNFFDSKEELLVQIIEHNHRQMFQSAVNVDLDLSLSAKEKLIKKVVISFEDFHNNKDFMTMLFRALPEHDNPRILQLMKRIRATMMAWHRDSLMDAFGKQVEPYIWDLVLMFQGTMREYLSLVIHEHKNIDIQRTACFIVEQLDTMVHHTTNPQPVLSSQEMKEFEEFVIGFKPETPEEQMDHLLEEMNQKVRHSLLREREQQEILSAIHLLKEEINGSEPRRYLIKSLLLYLAENEELQNLVHRVEIILRR